jgi:prevent-host-death family protein
MGIQTVSMVELRDRAEEIVKAVCRGQRMVLTYRGRPVMRLEPVVDTTVSPDDAFYGLAALADPHGGPLTNEQIDSIVYGSRDLR